MPDTQRNEFVGIIVKESERLTRLIDDVLDIAKMEAGEIDWQLQILDPRPIIEEAVHASEGLFHYGANNVTLDVDLASDLPHVNADADRLTQVVVNLMSNAAKFCDKADGLGSRYRATIEWRSRYRGR